MDGSIAGGTLVGGRWRIVALLGEGGFGQVYRAVDESQVGLGEAAVKVLHPNTSPQERNEFLREVQKIAALRHQNLVGYLDSGHHQSAVGAGGTGGEIRPYLVTELCAGSLADRLDQRPSRTLAAPELLAVLADMAAGLVHLHDRNLIHRDLKPGNVLYADGNWKLADFGLMRDLSLTGSYHRGDLLIGTPLFMAPELFNTMTATPASDLYALGVLAHLAAAGRHLHTGSGTALVHNITSTPPAIDQALDPFLLELITRSTATDPAHRLTARQLQAGLASRAGSRTQVAPLSYPPPAANQPTAAGHPSGPTSYPPPAANQPTVAGHQPSARTSYAPPAANQQPGGGWIAPGPVSGPSDLVGPSPLVAGAPQRSKLPVAALLGALVAAVALAAGGGLLAIQWLADRDGSAGEQLAAGQQDGGSTGSTEQGAEGEGSDTVDTGGNVELGDSGIIGESGDTGAAVGLVPDPASHLDVEPCAGGGDLTAGSPLEALAEVQVTNRHSEPVDYQLKVDFFTGDGARLDETYDSVYALPPGESALLQFRSFEVGAVACELVELTSTAVDRAAYDARGNTEIQSCELDDFFDNQVNTQYRATNPLDVTADLEIWFAVLDSEGIRIDDSFSSTFSDVAAGGAIQETAEETYFDLPWAGRTVAECIVTKMEVEPAT